MKISDEDPKQILSSLGLTQSKPVRHGPSLFVWCVVALAVASFLGMRPGWTPPGAQQASGIEIATGILALGTLLVGYQQWRSAKHEASLERFYDRLETANERLAQLQHHRVDPFDMYIFAELDNLEYVAEKYRLGYMSVDHAFRGLKTFQARMNIPQFHERLSSYRDLTDLAGYHPRTEIIVRRILKATNIRPLALIP